MLDMERDLRARTLIDWIITELTLHFLIGGYRREALLAHHEHLVGYELRRNLPTDIAIRADQLRRLHPIFLSDRVTRIEPTPINEPVDQGYEADKPKTSRAPNQNGHRDVDTRDVHDQDTLNFFMVLTCWDV